MAVDIKTRRIKSKNLQKLQRKIKDLASGLTQGALSALPVLSAQHTLSAKIDTWAERAECAKCKYEGPNSLQQL